MQRYTLWVSTHALQRIPSYAANLETRAGMGSAFFEELDRTLNYIQTFPKASRLRTKSIRVSRVRRFHYLIAYAINESTSTIAIVDIFAPGMNWEDSV